jgi:hypothetical protein
MTGFESRYQALEPSTPSTKMEVEGTTALSPVEMVTVPALGPEWAKSELHDMTKASKREKKAESRREKWKRWNRGETGMCGSFCTRQLFVWFMFGVCVVFVPFAFLARFYWTASLTWDFTGLHLS